MRAILLPIERVFSVLWGVVLVPGGGGSDVTGALLLGQLLAEGLLPRLHRVWHHRIDERQRLDWPTIKHRTILLGH